jgi:hypothetical protein
VLRLLDLVYPFEPDEADQALSQWLAVAPDDGAQGWTKAELAKVTREEHTTFSWLLEPMLDRGGFETRDRSFENQAFAAYTCV